MGAVLSSLSNTTADDDNEEASKRKPNERSTKSLWTFAHVGPASSFVWDPTLGVESAESDNPDDNPSNNQTDDGNMISGASSFSMCFFALLPFWAWRISF